MKPITAEIVVVFPDPVYPTSATVVPAAVVLRDVCGLDYAEIASAPSRTAAASIPWPAETRSVPFHSGGYPTPSTTTNSPISPAGAR